MPNTTTTISIIIASYNAENYIEQAIKSIINQSGSKPELIIIDGKSKDKTVTIIEKYQQYIDYWISESDKGIYDAWNKGVQQAKGEWIMFLGCDDMLLPDALMSYTNYIKKEGDKEYISSKVQMVDLNMKPIRIKGWKWEWPRFLNEMTVAHPGSLHSKKLFQRYGLFDISYKIVGDYELLLRPKDKLQAGYMDKLTVTMTEGGMSDSVAGILEQYKATVKTGNQSKIKALFNTCLIVVKFSIKKSLRMIGINGYLRK